MAVVLVTGASGFIGRSLAAELAGRHDVIAMSRNDPGLDLPWVKGEFFAWEDLRRLDGHEIDVAVHLAAVLSNVHEREQMRVNVEGTRCLMRYLIDRGCRKFVTASSIAAVGIQDTRFRPLQLPVPDDHPCLDRSGYGFSKFMMEEVTRYCQRQNEEVDAINLRLSSVAPDDKMPEEAHRLSAAELEPGVDHLHVFVGRGPRLRAGRGGTSQSRRPDPECRLSQGLGGRPCGRHPARMVGRRGRRQLLRAAGAGVRLGVRRDGDREGSSDSSPRLPSEPRFGERLRKGSI